MWALPLCHFILHEHHLYCVFRTEKHYFTNQTMMLSNYPDLCLFKHSNVSYSSTWLVYFVAGCIHTHIDVPVNCAPQIWIGDISVLVINPTWDGSPELEEYQYYYILHNTVDPTQSAHWEWPLAHADPLTMPMDCPAKGMGVPWGWPAHRGLSSQLTHLLCLCLSGFYRCSGSVS